MDSFFQPSSSKDDANEDIDEDYHFYEQDALKYLKESQPTNYNDFNKSKTIFTDVKPFSYYLKLYNKKQMLELDNPTFLSNQYMKQKKIANKLAKVNKSSEKYKVSNKKVNEEDKIDEEDESDQFNPLKNLNQQLIQEHKKVFSYNQYQNPNSFKHFIVNKNIDNNISNDIINENLDTNIEIDLISDIKNNSSEKTEDNHSSIIDTESIENNNNNSNNNNNILNRPKSSSKPVNKLIKNIKQKFNFKKNIIDIKLPTAILEDDQIPTTPNTTIVPNNSRLSTLSEIKLNKNNLITIDSKKSTLHQQPYLIDEKITKQAHSETQRLPPPPPNREMLTRIYNACNRKLKKPKLKVKPINQDNFEIESNQMNESVKTSKINKSNINNSKYKLILEYRNSDEKNHFNKPFVHTETKLRRAKFNENLKIESISSFSSVNYSLLNSGRQQIDNETRKSYRLKTNNLQLNPTVKVDDPIKENIKNYRTRLDDINQKLNNLNNVNVNNNNQFYVTEFIDEISKKNTSEPDAATEFNQFKMKKDKNKNYTSSEFNLASTKSISVIDLSDLTNEHDQKRIPFFSAFRPMRLNEYIKNTKNKPTKTLASLVIDKQLNQQKSVGSVAKRSIEAANNKFSNPVLSDSFMKASSGSTIQDHPTEIYRKDFSITNDSSVNSTRFLETIVSKKRVSFHEQVRK